MSDKEKVVTDVAEAIKSGDLDDFMTRMGDAIQYVTTKIVDVGVQAADLVLNLVQMKSIFTLVISVVVIVVTLLVRSKGVQWVVSNDETMSSEDKFFTNIVSWLPATAIMVYPISQLLSFYNWAGAIYPAAAIAMKALEAAGINL